MNDFTKEELEDIKQLASDYGNIDLYEKTKSMVDLYDAEVILVWNCEKCGHVQ